MSVARGAVGGVAGAELGGGCGVVVEGCVGAAVAAGGGGRGDEGSMGVGVGAGAVGGEAWVIGEMGGRCGGRWVFSP